MSAIGRARIADENKLFSALYDLYAERIATFRANPPPEGWDGVFALTTK